MEFSPSTLVNKSNPISVDKLQSMLKGPLQGKAQAIVDAAKRNGIDPLFLSSVVALETGWGTSKAVKDYNNPGGLMDSSTPDAKGFKKFGSVEEGLEAMARNLRKNYLDGGLGLGTLDTIDKIHKVYSPPGAANDPNDTNKEWGNSVVNIMNKLSENQVQNPNEVGGADLAQEVFAEKPSRPSPNYLQIQQKPELPIQGWRKA